MSNEIVHNCANWPLSKDRDHPLLLLFLKWQQAQTLGKLKSSLNHDNKQDEHLCQCDNKMFPLLDLPLIHTGWEYKDKRSQAFYWLC